MKVISTIIIGKKVFQIFHNYGQLQYHGSSKLYFFKGDSRGIACFSTKARYDWKGLALTRKRLFRHAKTI
jgi:hypothetical protein